MQNHYFGIPSSTRVGIQTANCFWKRVGKRPLLSVKRSQQDVIDPFLFIYLCCTRHAGAWGERRYSSYSFLTSALDGGERSKSRSGRALLPGKGPPVPIVQEAGWAPEPVWTQRLEEKSSASVGDRNPVVMSVISHCTDWATAAIYLFIFISSIYSCFI
jgi:hypothetical protein